MSMLPVSCVAAALAGLMLTALAAHTILLRRQLKVSLGDGGQERLQRAIRAHGNFSENTPIALLLLMLAELQGWDAALMGLVAGLMLTGRAVHAYALLQANGQARVAGMAMTFTALIGLAGMLLAGVF